MTGEQAGPSAPIDEADLIEQVRNAIRTVYDPEIPINIYELGLIYDIKVEQVEEEQRVLVEMTLTTPNCPAAQYLPEEVRMRTEDVAGEGKAQVDVVWDPPWDQSRMSDEALMQLGLI